MRCSFLEIYAECISDLLAPAAPDASASASLKLGYDRLQHGAFVKGLSSAPVQNGMGMARCFVHLCGQHVMARSSAGGTARSLMLQDRGT